MRKIHYAWWIMISCCLIMAGVGISVNTNGIFLQPVSDTLKVGRGSIAVASTIIIFAAIAVFPIAGKILSKYSVRWIVSIAVLITGIAFMAMSQFNSLIPFYITAVVLGVCNAFIAFLPVPILINNWFKQKVGIAMGIATAFTGISGALFNAIAINIISNWDWRAAYLFLGVAMIVVSLPMTALVIRNKPSDKGLLPYGAEKPEDAAQPTHGEQTPTRKITLRQALKSFPFHLVFFFASFLGFSIGIVLHIPGYAVSIGYPVTAGGLAVSVNMVGVIFSRVLLGYINDKKGTGWAVFIGIVVGIAGIFIIIFAQAGVWLLMAGSFLFGFSYALLSLGPPLVVRKIYDSRDFGRIYSFAVMGMQLFCAFSSTMFGFLFDLSGSYLSCLLITIAGEVISLICALFALKIGTRRTGGLSLDQAEPDRAESKM